MKKIFLFSFILACVAINAQQKNTLLDAEFWKKAPDVATVKAEIAKGNSPNEFNPFSFDATTLAINNGAPNETIKYLVELDGNGVKKITHDTRIYLHWAAYRGNAEIADYLLAKGSDVNFQDSHGNTPLAFGAANGLTNTAVYDAFFKAGVNPKTKYDGVSLLLLAIASDTKDLTLTNYFVTKGLSLKDTDVQGKTAIDYAARSGNIDVIKALQKKGVKHTDKALIMAAQGTRRGANSLDVFKYMVEELKIKATATGTDGETVLHYLVRKPKQPEIIAYFLSKGVDVNKADANGNTALINAAGGRDTAVTEQLLPLVKDINAKNAKGEAAVTAAVKGGSAEMVALLLNKGADINVTDKDGNNLAYYLIQSYRPQGGEGGAKQDDFSVKMKLLEDKGFNFATVQKDGSTLYHLAVAKNDLELVKRVSALKPDINAKNNEGLTALHKAALLAKDDETLKYLVSLGAKKDMVTEFDETAYALAKENEYLAKNNISVDFLK
ncbi:ankyrin repeat domain-containing protein [Flavobacterium sp. RHBU_24]|uniref:ankyrin repeat domain-containing protein n=1 Tax=Flavobacterium sp. RHBU_24 TaxID=3391185 RepID=UPI003984D692